MRAHPRGQPLDDLPELANAFLAQGLLAEQQPVDGGNLLLVVLGRKDLRLELAAEVRLDAASGERHGSEESDGERAHDRKYARVAII